MKRPRLRKGIPAACLVFAAITWQGAPALGQALSNTAVTEAQVSGLIPTPPIIDCNIVSGFLRDDLQGSNDCVGKLQSVAFDLGGGLWLYGYQLECHCGPNWDVGYVQAGGPITVPVGDGCVPLQQDFNNNGVLDGPSEDSFHTTTTPAFSQDLSVFNASDIFGKSPPDFTVSANFTGTAVEIFNANGIFLTGDVAGFVTNAPPLVVTGANLGGSSSVFDMCAPDDCCVPVEDPDVRTQGFWKRVCNGPHPSGEHENLPGYVGCVRTAATFANVSVDGLCDRLNPDPKNDKCEQAEAQFMALLLNVCSGRVADCNCVFDSTLGQTTVGDAVAFIDGLLSNPNRTFEDCVLAQAIADAINNGLSLVSCQ